MKKNIVILFIIGFSIGLEAQNQPKTNIDLNYLRPNWMGNNLNSIRFRNGDTIKIVRDLEEWVNKKKNIPQVYIKQTAEGDEYYYNYYALADERNIIPKNYKLPSLEDFQIDFLDFDSWYRGKFYSKNPKLKIGSYGSLGLDESSGNPYFTEMNNSYTYMWINEPNSDKEYWGNALIKKENYHPSIQYSASPKTYGYVVRCIENFDEILKDTSLDYSLLIPDAFLKLKNKLMDNITINNSLKEKESFLFSSILKFDSWGNNISEIKPNTNKNDLFSLHSKLTYFVTSHPVYPFYNDTKIKSSTPLKLEIERLKDKSNGYEDFSSFTIPSTTEINWELDELFDKCMDRGFKYKSKNSEYKFLINEKNEKNINKKYLYKLKGKGPVYSILSIIPGLGLNAITNDSKNNNSKSQLKKHITRSAITLGSVAVLSKIYSNYFYGLYKKDFRNTEAELKFKNANIAQKLFVFSIYSYGIIGLVDFTMTFTIGCKNKKFQHQANSKINDLNQVLIVY